MDEQQLEASRRYGYGSAGETRLIEIEDTAAGREQALVTLRDWFDQSCGLRFIQAVRTVTGDPNEGYTDIVEQCGTWIE